MKNHIESKEPTIMAFEDKELFQFLDSQGGSFVVIMDGVVVYAGTIAKIIFGRDIVGTAAAELFDEVLLPPSPSGVHGSVKVRGKDVSASSSNLGPLRIISLEYKEDLFASNVVEMFAMAVRDVLTDAAVSVGALAESLVMHGCVDGVMRMSHLRLAQSRMERCVNNLERVFADNAMHPHMRLISLEAMLKDLVRTLGMLIREIGVELKTDLSKEKRYFYGDRRLLELAVVNLISNSIKATPSGGQITVHLSCSDSSAIIRVSDTGPGISPEKRGTAFAANTVPPSLTGMGVGAGLGLGVVQRVAGLHSGAAMIDGRPGEGSSVSLLLPYRDTPDQDLHAPDEDNVMSLRELMVEMSDVLPISAYDGAEMR